MTLRKKFMRLEIIILIFFEEGENYIIYKIESLKKKKPNLNDNQIKKEIIDLVVQKNKFDYNKNILEKN
jgi:peptidyl-prolyl cis-trans isomerase D